MSLTGKQQAESLAQALKEEKLSAIYSSPLQRALETARAIAQHHALEVRVEPELRELEVGDLEGVLAATLSANFSHYLVSWQEGEGLEKLPGGESLSDLQKRGWSVIQRIVSQHDGTVAVVSHYFVILTIICAALGLPPSGIKRFRISVSSISTLDFKDGQVTLTSLGDTCHLR